MAARTNIKPARPKKLNIFIHVSGFKSYKRPMRKEMPTTCSAKFEDGSDLIQNTNQV